ncbi:MAG TPA: GWxTD domain-containing protein [Thermoanaerobaculia bacterium]|nr:GWxTD domain-containing protein [Thermoanaerobaculia bacterium]
MRKSLLLLATVLLALPLLAADLGKYQEWTSSPASYFLTFDERAEWTKLQTEAEAEAFVQKYIAARGGEKFTAELNKRVQMADKYLTVSKLPGSQTTRGKIVIVLGPPKSMNVEEKQSKAARTGTAAMAVSAVGASGPSASDMAEVAGREAMGAGETLKIYTFVYDTVTVPVEVNAGTGKDRIRDRKANAALERALEAAAKASIVAK